MVNAPKLIAIVGMPGAGKSVAADFFRSKQIPVLRFGDQTEIGVKEMGLPLTPQNERIYREKLRQELGMAAQAIKIEPRINAIKDQHKLIVLDGLYSWEEYTYLSQKFSEIVLLAIYARPTIRYERLSKRKIRPVQLDKTRERDVSELEKLNKGGPIAIADYLIKNETTQEDFIKELEIFFASL